MIKVNQLIIVLLSLIGFSSYNCFSQDDFVQINYFRTFENISAKDNKLHSFSGIEAGYSYPFLYNFFVKADASIMFYNKGSYFNSSLIQESFTPFSFNASSSYVFSDFLKNAEPLILLGFGYTKYKSDNGGLTLNYGAGFQYWFNLRRISYLINNIGLNMRVESRSFLRNKDLGNYIIASFGISFSLY